tara:strand:+ start:565 stop:1494 length:930 start_codon:yes stop_codon:yes gene_type:complete
MISKKIVWFYIFFSFILVIDLNANINNKIIIKVEDKIITNYELKNKILTTLYLAGEKINQEKINKLKEPAANSLISNKLKLIELDKFKIKTNNIRLNSYLNSISSNNIIQLKKDFENNDLDFDLFKLEAEIQIRWQEFIFKRYSSKIDLDETIIENEINKSLKNKKKLKKYNISEIEINLNNSNDDKNIVSLIKNEISTNGFENTALKYSISNSSKNKGDLGWIEERSLSQKILKTLSVMKVGDISEPIERQGSLLFLKLNDVKESQVNISDKEELRKKLIDQKKNELFTLYSNSHLSKLKNTSFIEYK